MPAGRCGRCGREIDLRSRSYGGASTNSWLAATSDTRLKTSELSRHNSNALGEADAGESLRPISCFALQSAWRTHPPPGTGSAPYAIVLVMNTLFGSSVYWPNGSHTWNPDDE